MRTGRPQRNNAYKIVDGVVHMELVSRGSARICLFDEADLSLILGRRWCYQPNGHTAYVESATRPLVGTKMKMHRLILGLLYSDEIVDHLNGNGLDNRRCNLRAATYGQNAFNRHRSNGASSGYRGVTKHPQGDKYRVRVFLGDRTFVQHGFSSPEEANEVAIRVRAEFEKGGQ